MLITIMLIIDSGGNLDYLAGQGDRLHVFILVVVGLGWSSQNLSATNLLRLRRRSQTSSRVWLPAEAEYYHSAPLHTSSRV